MRFSLTACVLFALASSAALISQDNTDVHQQTTTPPVARYEVIQSELAARLTFRLDRFSGHIAQLVKTTDDEDAWEDMLIIGLPHLNGTATPRFQVFTSGIAARFTFLIDTETGKTWMLVKHSEKAPDGTDNDYDLWQPLARDR